MYHWKEYYYGLGQWSENVVTLVQLHYTSNAVIGADGFGFRPCPERGLVNLR
jgi:hypothetical protein